MYLYTLPSFLCLAQAAYHLADKNYDRRDQAQLANIQDTASANGVLFQGFEWYIASKTNSSHWDYLDSQLQKLSDIGIDRIWIPPATKAAGFPSVGYDVYDLWDLGEFNQRGRVSTSWGTKDRLQALSRNATNYGISLMADAVLNQKAGAESTALCQAHTVSAEDRLQSTGNSTSIDAFVTFTFPARAGRYSNKTWSCGDFTAVDYDNATNTTAIWKIEGQNNDFALDVSHENGNYDYLVLADVAYHNPTVQQDVKAWGSWFVDEVGLGGFRLDAAKHISQSYMLDWVNNVESTTGKDLLFVAEYLIDDSATIEQYANSMMDKVSVFDSALQARLHQFSTGQLTDLRTIFDDTWLGTNASKAVTYVMNHDTQIGQAIQGSNIQGWFLPLAYALILLREAGYPCIFYGDLYGMYNTSEQFTPPQYGTIIADLALARKYYAYGQQTDYFGGANLIGWTLQGISDHPDGLAVVMSNAQGVEGKLVMNVGIQHAGEKWSSLFGGTGNVTIGEDGTAEFVAGAGTVNMYTRTNATERSTFGKWSHTT